MTASSLRDRLTEHAPLTCGWVSLPEPLIGEACVRAGLPAVLIDMQHGLPDIASAFALIAGIRRAGGHAIARIPVGEYQTASRLVDAGAEMIVAPMIESAADAAAFASFVKYPPLGQRSWGPTRAVQLAGGDAGTYRAAANRETLAVAMIETVRALDAVEEILALPGIDGVFVGPADLSIALSNGETLDVDSPANQAAFARVVAAATAAGKVSGIYAASGGHARRYHALGFTFATLMSDLGYLTAGVKVALAEITGTAIPAEPGAFRYG